MFGTTFVVLHWDRFKNISDLHCLFTALHCAASRGYNKIVELLVRECKGLQVDVEDKYGCTPLFYAASHNQPTTVHSLLSYGANPDHQDKKGRTWVYNIQSFIPIEPQYVVSLLTTSTNADLDVAIGFFSRSISFVALLRFTTSVIA